MKKATKEAAHGPRTVATNRKARHEYFIEEIYEAGIVLTGTVDSVTVENTRVTPTSIRVNLFSKGRVNLDVKGL